MRLPANGRPDRVGDAHDEGATALAVPEGVQSVGCLAGLRDEEANVVPTNGQIMRGTRTLKDTPFVKRVT